ncbi:MAG TPA: hypothetical protein VKA61_07225, partial [Sphingomicrobium sp.]|nr:hypothetical protein [Sphingomicrobium sp.]
KDGTNQPRLQAVRVQDRDDGLSGLAGGGPATPASAVDTDLVSAPRPRKGAAVHQPTTVRSPG